ncbi:MAG: hypothetical protein C0616_06035 [Desulfuromonas sp.]|nr:MAG: hypothetical protein C0616_06035 [Desulfuromonas sp.]
MRIDHDRGELKSSYDALLPKHEAVLTTLYRQVRGLLENHGFTPTIKYRIKRFNPYYEKLKKVRRGEKGGESGTITDLLGLRIICPFLEDIDIVVDLLSRKFQVVESQRKGSQHSFREFAYDSVHLLIKLENPPEGDKLPYTADVCEFQLRTILQDAWAEVEHELVYKSDITLPNESIKRKLAALNANLTLSDLIFQELRDYQKQVRHSGQKRRASLDERLNQEEVITISHGGGWQPAPANEVGPLPSPLANDLERTMLDALKAHSHNEFETAVELYGDLLQMELDAPVRALVLNHRGMAHFSLGNYESALDDFSASTALDGVNPRSWCNRALANRVLRAYKQSIEDYNRALSLDPVNGEGLFGRAQTYCEMHLFTKALEDCELVLGQQPDYLPARQLMESIRRGVFGGG